MVQRPSTDSAAGLHAFTTLHLGGPAARMATVTDDSSVIESLRVADDLREPVLLFGGGSNLVVADAGWDGLALRIASRGIAQSVAEDGRLRVDVAAGEVWDDFVAMCVATGLAGVEALSGIPGTVGGTPIQNVGAYGQEVADTIRAVKVYDRSERTVTSVDAAQCGFGYRRSMFQLDPHRFVVLGVTFLLARSRLSGPLSNRELCQALGMQIGAIAPTAAVREAILELRHTKGMVLVFDDHDTWSAGSFFKTVVLNRPDYARFQSRLSNLTGPLAPLPASTSHGRTSIPAGWLVENSGFYKGYPLRSHPDAGIALSTKHALALTNRGSGTTRELVALAHEVAAGVRERFGVRLDPEPVFVGHEWTDPD